MIKKFLLIILVSIAIGLGWYYLRGVGERESEIAPNNEVESVGESVTLVLDFGEGEISTYSGIPIENSVYGVLESLTLREEIEVDSEHYDFGVFVKSIGDKEGSEKMAWIYFVNGESGNVAADQKSVYAGDVIEWKYIRPN